MLRFRKLLFAVPLVAFGVTCTDRSPVEVNRCAELRDHVVDLQLRNIHIATGVDIEAHRKALTDALGDDFLTSCSSRMDEARVSCLLDASDQDAAQACIPQSSQHAPEEKE